MYSWVGGLIGIIGAFLAWMGGKTYSNAKTIVKEELEKCVKICDYKEDLKNLKEDIKDVKDGQDKILNHLLEKKE